MQLTVRKMQNAEKILSLVSTKRKNFRNFAFSGNGNVMNAWLRLCQVVHDWNFSSGLQIKFLIKILIKILPHHILHYKNSGANGVICAVVFRKLFNFISFYLWTFVLYFRDPVALSMLACMFRITRLRSRLKKLKLKLRLSFKVS